MPPASLAHGRGCGGDGAKAEGESNAEADAFELLRKKRDASSIDRIVADLAETQREARAHLRQ
eukprot:3248373-Alexandrium_andersonii.AAC.1